MCLCVCSSHAISSRCVLSHNQSLSTAPLYTYMDKYLSKLNDMSNENVSLSEVGLDVSTIDLMLLKTDLIVSPDQQGECGEPGSHKCKPTFLHNWDDDSTDGKLMDARPSDLNVHAVKYHGQFFQDAIKYDKLPSMQGRRNFVRYHIKSLNISLL